MSREMMNAKGYKCGTCAWYVDLGAGEGRCLCYPPADSNGHLRPLTHFDDYCSRHWDGVPRQSAEEEVLGMLREITEAQKVRLA